MTKNKAHGKPCREVIHEDGLKVAGVTTAPDYSFKLIGRQRLFFVEAKKRGILLERYSPASLNTR